MKLISNSYSPKAVIDYFLKSLVPVKQMGFIEWIEKYRVVSSTSSSESGKYRISRTPYIRGILEAMADPKIPEISIMKGCQLGLTEAAINLIGYSIYYPKNILVIYPTLDMARKMSSQRIEPLIEEHSFLKERLQRNYKKTDNKLVKMFIGGLLAVCCANSSASIRSLPIQRAILDECDEYPEDLNEQGSIIDLVRGRFNAQKKSNKKIIALSSPTVEGISIINGLWVESSKNYFFLPCPHCGAFDYFRWEDFRYPKGEPEKIAWECPACKQLVNEKYKMQMMNKGEWRPTAEDHEKKPCGFHISSFYAPIGWVSWGEIAKRFEEIKGSEEKLKAFRNIYLGLPWSPARAKAPIPETLHQRRQFYKKNILDKDFIAVTCSIDVQGDRLEAEICAWDSTGVGSYKTRSVDYRVFYGDTNNMDDKCWTKDVKALLNETFLVEGTNKRVPIQAMCIDTGYNTSTVYQVVQKVLKDRRVFPIKGVDSEIPVGSPLKIDQYIKGKRHHNSVRVWPVGVTLLKSELYGWLQQSKNEDGTTPFGWAEFPDYGIDYFKMLCAEQIVVKKNKIGQYKYYWETKTDQARNEALDLRVYNKAAYTLAGFDKFDAKKWQLFREQYYL